MAERIIHKHSLHKAVTYAQIAEHMLRTHFEDGRCILSNNLSENAIRTFNVGRRNWLFSDSVNGTEVSAIVYTVAEKEKIYGLNTYIVPEVLAGSES